MMGLLQGWKSGPEKLFFDQEFSPNTTQNLEAAEI
jgi:hypothetical protein